MMVIELVAKGLVKCIYIGDLSGWVISGSQKLPPKPVIHARSLNITHRPEPIATCNPLSLSCVLMAWVVWVWLLEEHTGFLKHQKN